MISFKIIRFVSIVTLFVITLGFFSTLKDTPKDFSFPDVLTGGATARAQSGEGDFYISKVGANGFGAQKILTFTSQENTEISVDGYLIEGEANVKVYEGDSGLLLKYLTRDKNGKQTQKIDLNNLKLLTELKKNIVSNQNLSNQNRVDLQIQKIGIYFVQIQLKNITKDIMVLRTNLGVTANQSKDSFLFWGQDLISLRVLNDTTITTYNLENSVSVISQAAFNNEGMTRTKSDAKTDIALAQKGEDIALIPINLQSIGESFYPYSGFGRLQTPTQNLHLYTDRPIYKPGDKLYFKAITRLESDLKWSIPTGKIKVKVISYSGSEQDSKNLIKEFTLNSNGTINGEFDLPANLTPGDYSINASKVNPINDEDDFNYGNVYFSVQNYRKPTSELKVNLEKDRIILGEKNILNLEAKYLSGVPAGNNKVKVQIFEDNFTYFYDDEENLNQTPAFKYFQYYNYGNQPGVYSRELVLDNKGQAKLEIDTSEFAFNPASTNYGMSNISNQKRVFYVNANLDDKSSVPVVSSDNFLGYPAQFYFSKKIDFVSATTKKPYESDISLKPTEAKYKPSVSNQNIDAKIIRKWWDKKSDPNPNNKYDQYEEKLKNSQV